MKGVFVNANVRALMKGNLPGKVLTICSAVCLAATLALPPDAQAQPDCTPAPSGLVSWWTGDGIASDVIGGYNGILVGGVGFAAGEVGPAFSFDGLGGSVSNSVPGL